MVSNHTSRKGMHCTGWSKGGGNGGVGRTEVRVWARVWLREVPRVSDSQKHGPILGRSYQPTNACFGNLSVRERAGGHPSSTAPPSQLEHPETGADSRDISRLDTNGKRRNQFSSRRRCRDAFTGRLRCHDQVQRRGLLVELAIVGWISRVVR